MRIFFLFFCEFVDVGVHGGGLYTIHLAKQKIIDDFAKFMDRKNSILTYAACNWLNKLDLTRWFMIGVVFELYSTGLLGDLRIILSQFDDKMRNCYA